MVLEISHNLRNDPDLVMRPDLSLFILVDGMKRGVFTGIKLDDCISDNSVDFWSARKIINGTDQAERIQSYAMNWQTKIG